MPPERDTHRGGQHDLHGRSGWHGRASERDGRGVARRFLFFTPSILHRETSSPCSTSASTGYACPSHNVHGRCSIGHMATIALTGHVSTSTPMQWPISGLPSLRTSLSPRECAENLKGPVCLHRGGCYGVDKVAPWSTFSTCGVKRVGACEIGSFVVALPTSPTEHCAEAKT